MKRSRGNALPETALVMPLLILVVYGLIEITLTAFYQLSADGASFMGAQKSVALEGAGANLSSARTIATNIFSHVASGDVGVATPGPSSTSSAVFETNVSKTIANIGVPGFPQYQAIQSRTIEPGVGSTTSLGPVNFCSKSSGTSAFSLANTVNGGAQGVAPIVNEATGAVNVSSLANHVADLQGVSSGITGVASGLSLLDSTLGQIASLPGGSLLINGVLNAVLNAVQPVLNAALAGTSSPTAIGTLSATLGALLGPIEGTLSALGHSSLANQLATALTSIVTGLSSLNVSEGDLNGLTRLC
jgi:Flp pilus assembly protein TadG